MLTDRQITLARVALLQRMTRLKSMPHMRDSYEESKALCQVLWTMRQRYQAQDAAEICLEAHAP